jgi:hypothetical protein
MLFSVMSCNKIASKEVFYNKILNATIEINNDSLLYSYKIRGQLYNKGRFKRVDNSIFFYKWIDDENINIYDCIEKSCIAIPNIYSNSIIFSEDEEYKNFYKKEE